MRMAVSRFADGRDQDEKRPPVIQREAKDTCRAQEESHTQQDHNQACHPCAAAAGST